MKFRKSQPANFEIFAVFLIDLVWDYDFRRWSSLKKSWRRLKNRQDSVGYIGSSNLVFTQTKYLAWPE